MAQHIVLVLNQTVPQIQEPQVGDSYLMPKNVEVDGTLTVSGLINGVDPVLVAGVAATAVQPADNVSVLTNDAGYEANAALASQAEAEAGIENTKTMTPLRVAQAIAVLAAGLQNKLDGTSAPTTTNDNTEGYSVGSFWIDVTNDEAYRCVDATTNLAVWVKTTVQSSDLAAVALSGDSDDLTEGVTNLLLTVAERAKLAGIETAATADQTGAEIKAAYEAEADTNAFTDAHKARVDDLIGQELGIIANPGGGQVGATELTTHFNFVDTVGSVGDSVKLPAAVPGKTVSVKNRTSTSMDLFPQSGVQINALAANAALTVTGGTAVRLYAVSATRWEVISVS